MRPIGVGEVLRRIAGKVVMMVVKGDVKEAAGSLQLCAGQESGSEAAIHAMHDIFEDSETEAVLSVDAANAFNSINRTAILHNIGVICHAIATYVTNCYFHPARLFVIGGIEIRYLEGTTQGDQTAMATYALGLTPLLEELLHFELLHTVKLVAFADDNGCWKTSKFETMVGKTS